jgi:hypothetical protein
MTYLDEFIRSVKRQLAIGNLIPTNETYQPFTLELPIYTTFNGSDKYFPEYKTGNHTLFGVYDWNLEMYNKINNELLGDLRREIRKLPNQDEHVNKTIKIIACSNCLEQSEVANPLNFKKLKIAFDLADPPTTEGGKKRTRANMRRNYTKRRNYRKRRNYTKKESLSNSLKKCDKLYI